MSAVAECIACGEVAVGADAARGSGWEPAYLGNDWSESICLACWVNGEWTRCECCGDAWPRVDMELRESASPWSTQPQVSQFCGDCALECKYWSNEDCRILERRDHYAAKHAWMQAQAEARAEAAKPPPVTDEELSEVTAMISRSAQRLANKRPSETLRRSS